MLNQVNDELVVESVVKVEEEPAEEVVVLQEEYVSFYLVSFELVIFEKGHRYVKRQY
jgi:hypothetical protein